MSGGKVSYINVHLAFLNSQVPNWLMERTEVSPGAKLCYGKLCQYAGRDGKCYPLQETMAQGLGVSKDTVQRYIRELVSFKLIESFRRGFNKSNYYMFPTHEWVRFRFDDLNQEAAYMTGREAAHLQSGEAADMTGRRESVEENQLRDKKVAPVGALGIVPKKQSGSPEDIISQIPIPQSLDTLDFRDEWFLWVSFKMKNAKCKDWPTVFKKHMKRLETFGEKGAIMSLDQAMSAPWQQPYPPKYDSKGQFQNKNERPKMTLEQEFERTRQQREWEKRELDKAIAESKKARGIE